MKRLILFFMLLAGGFISAQEHCDSVRILFRLSSSELAASSDSGGPRAAIDSAVALLRRAQTDSLLRIARVSISGSASPEGTPAFNRRLSTMRAQALRDYLSSRDALTHIDFQMMPLGANWPELLTLAEADAHLPYRDETLSLLHDIVADASAYEGSLQPLRRLQRLRAGVPYRYLLRQLFPALRYAELSLCYTQLEPALPEPEPRVEEPEPRLEPIAAEPEAPATDATPEPEPAAGEPEPTFCRPLYLGLSTNMLYDLAAVPNLGAEIYLGRRWSIALDGMYAWWSCSRKNHYWRIYGVELTGRYWLGKAAAAKPLTGHHLGLYAQALTYDFEWGGRGYMGGEPGGNLFNRATSGFGLEYGYSLPIARRLNLDFALGLGYLRGKYYEYLPIDDCYVWQCTKMRHYWGPTRAAVSLVWLVGCDNYNRRKGGRR